jgi:hypothetical protein
MSKRKNFPTEPFRRTQVVSPVPSGGRFGKAKFEKKTFDIYVSDIETGDETLAITVFAPTQREAIRSPENGSSPRLLSAASRMPHLPPSRSIPKKGATKATEPEEGTRFRARPLSSTIYQTEACRARFTASRRPEEPQSDLIDEATSKKKPIQPQIRSGHRLLGYVEALSFFWIR